MTTALLYWKYIAIGVLLALLLAQTVRVGNLKDDVAACEARNLAQVSDWRAKYAEAVTEATQAKAATEAAQAKISKDIGNDTQKRLDALRASLAGSLRASAADPGSAKLPDLPRARDTAVNSSVTVDRSACGEAFIIATGWQDWWRQISEDPTP